MRIPLMIRPASRIGCAVLLMVAASWPGDSVAAERRGGIEIGAKGVKATAIELGEGAAVKTIMAAVSNTTVAAGAVKTGKYAPDAIRETADEAGKFARKMVGELGIPPEKIRVIGSSGLPKVANLGELVEAVAKATGLPSMELLTPNREVELMIAGLVPEAERSRAVLVDVGSGNSKGGFIGPGGNPACFSVPLGSVTYADRVTKESPGQPFAAAADRLRPSILVIPLADQVRVNPELAARPVVFLAGGAVYAMSTLLHPEAITEQRVKLSSGDIAAYLKLLGDGQKLTSPDLSSLSTPEVRAAAEQEVRNVLDTFTPENLLAGAEILTALSDTLKFEGKTLIFDRTGTTAWIRASLTPPPVPSPVPTPTPAPTPAPVPVSAATPPPAVEPQEASAPVQREVMKPRPPVYPSPQSPLVGPGPGV